MLLVGEEWKDVLEYEGLYRISSMGRFQILKTRRPGGNCGQVQHARIVSGSRTLNLVGIDGSRRRVFLCVLVLETFVGPRPPGGIVDGRPSIACCHRDDDRNNNRVENLYWGNASTNKLDAVRNGIANVPKGSKHKDAKLTEEIVMEARRLRRTGWSVADLCRKYNITGGPMSLALRGITWKHVE